MENEPEIIDSPNDETIDPVGGDDVDALREQNRRFADQNRQLFARAKKAEGFELKEGAWVKTEKVQKKEEPYKPPESKATPKTDDIDFAQLAFHNTKSDALKIESDEDIDFLRTTLKETGKTQKELLGAKWFQAELKERSEARATKEATPSGTRRSGETSAKTQVDYWLKRGELPPNTPENAKLRQEVVAMKRDLGASAFGTL